MRKTVVIAALAVLCAFGAAQAQSNIGFNGVGGYLGLAMPESDIGSTLAFGGRADLGTVINPNIHLAGDLMFWSKGNDEGDWEWSWSQFYISALALYFLGDPNANMKFYAGAGVGMVFAKWSEKYTGPDYGWGFDEDYSWSESDICIQALVGVQTALSDALTGFAEAGYILGGFDTLVIRAGAIFGLNK